jgi:hypothetical protein
VKFSDKELEQIAEANNMKPLTFKKNYMVAREKRKGVFLLQATYAYTNQARLPDDGKLREIRPDLNWLSIGGEHILSKPGARKYPPLPCSVIYT